MLDLLHAYAQGVYMEIVSARKQNVLDLWRGFDMHKYIEIDADLNLWKSVKIRKNVGCREDYN